MSIRAVEFDAARAWRLHPRVALRDEPFGALAYHFDTRRLSFLKSLDLVRVVRALERAPSAAAACDAAGIGAERRPSYRRALAELARGEMIVERER